MANRDSTRTAWVRAQSPAMSLDNQIRRSLAAISAPQNVFIEPGIAETTLDNAHSLMVMLKVIDVRDGLELPKCGEYVMSQLRQRAIDAIDYAHKLGDMEDEMRGAARREAAEVFHV